MTNLELLLSKSKELRDAATPGPVSRCGGSLFYPDEGAPLDLGSNQNANTAQMQFCYNTSETKDEIIRVLAEALQFIAVPGAARTQDAWEMKRAREALAQAEQLAKEAVSK